MFDAFVENEEYAGVWRVAQRGSDEPFEETESAFLIDRPEGGREGGVIIQVALYGS
jgi:hypothetical protein